jgi:hypothetical protein
MPGRSFLFVKSLSDADCEAWLVSFLRGAITEPRVEVPSDLEPIEFLLGQLSASEDSDLSLKVGTVAGKTLARMVRQDRLSEDVRLAEWLFKIVEALPVSQQVSEFLLGLALTDRLIPVATGGRDFHLLCLRALALHQLPETGKVRGLIEFWREQAADSRYAPIAIQGLLRLSAVGALDILPDAIASAIRATPPRPLINTLFSVARSLGTDQTLWRALISKFDPAGEEFAAARRTFRDLGLPRLLPEVWALFEQGPILAPLDGVFRAVYAGRQQGVIDRARRHLGSDVLLEPVA